MLQQVPLFETASSFSDPTENRIEKKLIPKTDKNFNHLTLCSEVLTNLQTLKIFRFFRQIGNFTRPFRKIIRKAFFFQLPLETDFFKKKRFVFKKP